MVNGRSLYLILSHKESRKAVTTGYPDPAIPSLNVCVFLSNPQSSSLPSSPSHGYSGNKVRGGWRKLCRIKLSGQEVAVTTAVPQGMGLQDRMWCLSPTQDAPPFLGGGLEQLLLLRDRPPPQLRSHQDQGLQRDQPPGTVEKRKTPSGFGSDRGSHIAHEPGDDCSMIRKA